MAKDGRSKPPRHQPLPYQSQPPGLRFGAPPRDAFPRDNEDAFLRQWLIEYLPIASLVAPAADQGRSWEDLRSEHAEARTRKGGAPSDFKQWVRQTYNVRLSDYEISAAAASMDEVPDEFVELGHLLRAMPRR